MIAQPVIGSLCSGYGGVEQGIELAIGPVRHAWHAEVDPDASAVLAANWPGVPNLGDITAVDWDQVPRVDILAAGYPCQGESNAGLRRGTDDPRWRWPDVARAVRELRPGLVVLENVRGHLRRGFGTVVADLAALGYVGSWVCVRASDVGAPHRRERVVIVAWPAADAPGLGWAERRAEPARSERGPGIALGGAEVAGHASGLSLLPTPSARDGRRGAGWGEQPGRPLSETVMRLLPTPRVSAERTSRRAAVGAHSRSAPSLEQAVEIANGVLPRELTDWSEAPPSWHPAIDDARWGEYAAAIARWEAITGRAAPEPTEPGRTGSPRLSPRFVEWLMGLEDGHVTKHVPEVDPKGVRRPTRVRTNALRILGNGAVPQQMAYGIKRALAQVRVTKPAPAGECPPPGAPSDSWIDVPA